MPIRAESVNSVNLLKESSSIDGQLQSGNERLLEAKKRSVSLNNDRIEADWEQSPFIKQVRIQKLVVAEKNDPNVQP